ncbi:MAG: filamentous hemagglutinin N-terminal domain-containing protein, partial [Caulobacteraceae bacterium]|nr:filamentous hemagglutinin N-terminal domain-containing protein [Caulobacteraceae bacterium]
MRARLLWGASFAAIIGGLSAHGAQAQTLNALGAAIKQSIAARPATTPSAASIANAAAMLKASANALRYQTQVNLAINTNLAAQAQAAAQAAASALNQSAGIADGLTMGCVPGASACGLTPAVSAAALASADPTGLATWQGAQMPTLANPSNPNQVTVVQTDPRALLSWTSFNVGQNTTLTFQQQVKGVNQPSWIVLNRVVGGTAPSTILGKINAPGTVLVLNQNGILFGAGAQVNVGSLVASTLEIGHAVEGATNNTPITLSQRNAEFLEFGLLGYAEQNTNTSGADLSTFSTTATYDPSTNADSFAPVTAPLTVAEGASLTSANGGYLMLLGPNISDAGEMTSPSGEVALQSADHVTLTASQGNANSVDPDVRGLVVTGQTLAPSPTPVKDSVQIASTGIIQVPLGYVSVGASSTGSVTDAGVISSTTSVSENGYVNIFGGAVNLASGTATTPGAVIAIEPDSSSPTIPQDPTSLAAFKPSRVRIGEYALGSTSGAAPATTGSLIDIGAYSLIYAPSANISIGADPGPTTVVSSTPTPTSSVLVESGAVIDAAGLPDVEVPASRNTLKIDPVKGNELADAPAFRNGFLNGATVYLDPRLSGVTADGVAWVGSPLISAAAYAEQVGVSVSELMLKGGNVT